MTPLADLLDLGRAVPGHAPWPRVVVDADTWLDVAALLGEGGWTLLSLWADGARVHMAVADNAAPPAVAVVGLDAERSTYPSISRYHPAAIRLERALRDLTGLHPEGLPDARPWLDHGAWGLGTPLAVSGGERAVGAAPEAYQFLRVEGEDLHEIPVGPVHAGVIEPGHFRFTVDGETVVRLEQRLGYTHKGLDSLLAGSTLDHAARLAGRVSGDSTVAYALAFARAAEAACLVTPPPRAVWLRALMAELERMANHIGDIGAVCNDASFAIIHAHCGVLRERVLRAAAACFGHRLMMDRIVPGGVAVDLDDAGIAALRALLREIGSRLPQFAELYDQTASLQDRTVTTGILRPELVRRFGCGGPVGRASGRDFDTRRDLSYPPYDQLRFTVAVQTEGDVNARVWVRIRETDQCVGLIHQLLAGLPDGAIRAPVDAAAGAGREGMALAESFRGDVLAWLRLDAAGTVGRCHLRDPSWFQWPLLEAAIEGNIVADFPLCNKSFNCSYSGADL
jgi:Ni,Fe-hydrogenase III large subunit